MKIKNLTKKILVLSFLGTVMLTGCNKEANFDPPNKDKISTGSAENIVTNGSAMTIIKYSDKMAKLWNKDAFLVGISGSRLDESGKNISTFEGSQWIMTYYNTTKGNLNNTYTITMNGKGNVSWLESNSNYSAENNISNFSVDSGKALSAAFNAGLTKSDAYIAELSKNTKGMLWTVGYKINGGSGYELKKVDAISGAIVN